MITTSTILPCVFSISEPEQPVGTLVYFHPGGLPSEIIHQLAENFVGWRVLNVELMMCQSYIEAIDRRNELCSSIEAIAQQIYLQLDLELCGRLVFVGWSFGGVIAFQMASMYTGNVVPQLVMFDSIAPINRFSFSDKNVSSGITLRWFLQYLQALKKCKLHIYDRWWKTSDQDFFLQELFAQSKRKNIFDEQTHISGFKKVFSTFTKGLIRNSKLTAAYKAKPSLCHLLLVRAKFGLLKRFFWIRHMGWKPLVKNIRVESVPFDHYQIISDPRAVRQLAGFIDEFILSKPKLAQK